jgi:hypothetical protein
MNLYIYFYYAYSEKYIAKCRVLHVTKIMGPASDDWIISTSVTLSLNYN